MKTDRTSQITEAAERLKGTIINSKSSNGILNRIRRDFKEAERREVYNIIAKAAETDGWHPEYAAPVLSLLKADLGV